MNDPMRVEFVVSHDPAGRVKTISVEGPRTSAGWFLLPGRTASRVQLAGVAITHGYVQHTGQSETQRGVIDPANSDASLTGMSVVGGFIVESNEPLATVEIAADIDLIEDDINPWIYPPDLERQRRQSDPELFEGDPCELELGVWYPVELSDEAEPVAYGVFQLVSKQGRRMRAIVRCVLLRKGVSLESATLRRYGREVGRVLTAEAS